MWLEVKWRAAALAIRSVDRFRVWAVADWRCGEGGGVCRAGQKRHCGEDEKVFHGSSHSMGPQKVCVGSSELRRADGLT